MKAASVEALTVDNIPVVQEARLEDYSPEMWAPEREQRCAEVLNMLRYVIGDEKFFKTLKDFAQQNTRGRARSPRTFARWRRKLRAGRI